MIEKASASSTMPPSTPAAPGPGLAGAGQEPALRAMLEARSVALVGASPRPDTLGERMVAELARSPAKPTTYLVNPRYTEIGGVACHPSLADVPEPVDLVLLGVPDAALAGQVELAARRGDRSAVIFGGAYGDGLRDQIATVARGAGMALCGAGCMGFVNTCHGLRAIGYAEPDPAPAGPIALVTHSGSVFSALLRTRRPLGYTVAVSSGQELVTTAARYAAYALHLHQTRVLALVLEAMRDARLLEEVLGAASVMNIPVVLLTAGSSAAGRALVTAHSGALAGADGAWEALAGAYGVHRVADLAELADTLELFTIGRRAAPGAAGGRRRGIATVHDSGLERAHVADLAGGLGVPFGEIGAATSERLAGVLDPGLEPGNPLDMWSASTNAQWQLTESLTALADDPAVAAVALAVDLVTEHDGDRSYPLAVADAARRTTKPVAVLANIPSAVDQAVAGELRAAGIPVLEGARSGLLALGHLLAHGTARGRAQPPPPDPGRSRRWAAALRAGQTSPHSLFCLLADYGIPVARTRAAGCRTGRAGRGRADRVPGGAEDRRTGPRAQVGRGRGRARHPGSRRAGRRVRRPRRAFRRPGPGGRDGRAGHRAVAGHHRRPGPRAAGRGRRGRRPGGAPGGPGGRAAPGRGGPGAAHAVPAAGGEAAGRVPRPAARRPRRRRPRDHRGVGARLRAGRRAGRAGHQPADLRSGRGDRRGRARGARRPGP